MAKVRIEDNGASAKIFVNGKEVPDVRRYSIVHEGGDLVKFEMDIATTDLTLDAENWVPELPSVFRDFYERIKAD